MNGVFQIGATGLRSQERALEIAANNIANLNTPGFKRAQIRFGELVTTAGVDPLKQTTAERLVGAGVAAEDAGRDFTGGEIRRTGAPLDLAVDGDGLIEVLGPDGRFLLWRGGRLSVDADGLLTNQAGLPLRALITIPEGAKELKISSTGVVTAVLPDSTAPVELGRIDLVLVQADRGLKPIGDGLYEALDPRALKTMVPGEDGAGHLAQGAVEASNVELSSEMVALLMLQRAYAANAQVLQAGDQLMAIANGLKR
ncbi:flagellar hook-basal body protein [Brevundimonas faecalis]|uniref:Flagellar basal-body rod protein FlgG n=1 Tax=Brevundimonas faecalis TaxID=947378 RepID=A0ABV2R7K6_9CAUL